MKNVCDKKGRKVFMRKGRISEKAIIFGIIVIFIGISIVPSVSPEDPWWNENWNYRKQVTIDHTKVGSQLQNFPVLINSVSSDYITHAQADGDDFVFTTSAGVKLNHEIESYDSASGKLVAWANIPSLSSTEDTVIWLYYGNPTSNNQQNSGGTWNTDFKAVYHLKDTTSTTTKDSTDNNYLGTKKGVNEPTEINAIISKAQVFDGLNDYIKHGDILDNIFTGPDAQFTISCWMKMTTYSDNACMVGKNGDSNQGENNRQWVFYCTNYTYTNYHPKFAFLAQYDLPSGSNYRFYMSDTQYTTNVWYYVTTTYNAALVPENRGKIFINGTPETGSVYQTGTGYIQDGSAQLSIGGYIGQSESKVASPFPGIIDEVRISTGIRSNAWIKTEYNTMYSPNAFLSIGEEQPHPSIPNVSPIANAGGPYYANVNNAITFDGSGSSDTDGTITGYRWDWTNDGTYDTDWLTSATTTHSYSSVGTYTVNLEVKDNDGATSNDTATVTITSEGGAVPNADANGPYSGYVIYPVSFSSSGSVGGSEGFITSWYWTFGDGTVSSQQNPTHAYTSSGTFTVTLKVTNNYGQTDTDTTSATITTLSPTQTPPVANAGGPYFGVVGTSITFNGSGSNDPDGTIVSYMWNFGDSTTGTGISPTHTYTIPGNYTVVLTVTDNESLTHSNSTTASINVSGPPTIKIKVDLSNIEPIEEENQKTFSVTIQCEHQSVSNIHLEILEQSKLTIISLPANISLNPGESRELLVTIKAPKLPENASKETIGDETIVLRAVAEGNITSNNETVNFKVIKADATPGFEAIATFAAVGSVGALVTFFRRRNRNR